MATTYYAWSPIRYGAETDQKGAFVKHKEVKLGAEVTQERIKATDEEWAELKRVGAVRKDAHPDMGNFTGSPVDYFREQARKAANGGTPAPEEDEEVEEEVKT